MAKTAQRIVERVLALANSTLTRNQFNSGALNAAPTISGSDTSTATANALTRHYPADASLPRPWNVYGGEIVEDSGGVLLNSVISDGDASPPTRSPQSGQFEFMLDGDLIEFELDVDKPYRFLVEEDGVLKYVDKTGLGLVQVTSGSKAFYLLSFADRGPRRVQLDQYVNSSGGFVSGRFYGVRVKDTDRVYAPSGSDELRWITTGDSWVQGRNGPASDSFMNVVSKSLGVKDHWTAAVGGTGVLAQPDVHSLRYGNRPTDWSDFAPHIMDEAASGNDFAAAPYNGGNDYFPTLIEAHMASLDARRAAYPNAIIFMVGLQFSLDDVDDPECSWVLFNEQLKTATLARNDNYCRFIDPNDGVDSAITGVFHWTGTESDGDGNTSIYEADHMTAAGDHAYGTDFAQRFHKSFVNMFYGETGTEVEASFDNEDGTALVFEGQEITVPIALATGTAGIALGSVDSSPALPAGLSVDVVSGGKLQLTGTPTGATGSGDYVLAAERIDHGDPVEFTLHLEAYGEPNWVHEADESETFVLTESSVVRFGVGGTWWYKRLSSGTYTSAVFGGDPKPFWVKTVEIDTTA